MSEPSKWDEATYGPMSLESIRRLFQPESHYRVSWTKYPAGAAFNGWSRAGRLSIIDGGFTIRTAGHSWDLSTGEFLDVPEGDHFFSVTGESSVELVWVWELPEIFWGSSKDTQAVV